MSCVSFPYHSFESAVLSQLAELDVDDVVGDGDSPDELTIAENELAHVRQRTAELTAELTRGGSIPALTGVLRELAAQEQELSLRVDMARERVAVPLAQSWDASTTLLGAVTNAADPIDVRLRLRSALRRVVSGIRVVFFSSGRNRFAFAKVTFAGGGVRIYAIMHTPPKANDVARIPGRWWARSMGGTGSGLTGFGISGPIVDDPSYVPDPKFVAKLTAFVTDTTDGATTGELP